VLRTFFHLASKLKQDFFTGGFFTRVILMMIIHNREQKKRAGREKNKGTHINERKNQQKTIRLR
jgi:hypothetical protein